MDKYIWIFPVLFIFHDMEEVIWLSGFIDKNREDIIKRYIPSLVTSIMTLSPSIMLLIHTKSKKRKHEEISYLEPLLCYAGLARNHIKD